MEVLFNMAITMFIVAFACINATNLFNFAILSTFMIAL